MLDNINNELKKGYNENQKVALFYMKLNDKQYYYSYNLLDNGIEDLYNSYRLVNIKQAKQLLAEQINC